MKIHNRFFSGIFACIVLFFFFSCTVPSPVFGQWADNNGNKLIMNADLSFLMTLKLDNKSVTYEGTYKLISNAVSFYITNGRILVSEWDIRGSVLSLTLPDPVSGRPINLELYQAGK